MIDFITRKGVPHQNKFCNELHCRGALGCEKGPSVRLRLIKCGSRACLFWLLCKPGRGWWIKHLGHVAFFISVCVWYTLPFRWNYSHHDKPGRDGWKGEKNGEEGESGRSKQDLKITKILQQHQCLLLSSFQWESVILYRAPQTQHSPVLSSLAILF